MFERQFLTKGRFGVIQSNLLFLTQGKQLVKFQTVLPVDKFTMTYGNVENGKLTLLQNVENCFRDLGQNVENFV
jgi:hypothetical protein